MKTVRMYRVLATFLGMTMLTACQLDPLNDNLKKEEYTRAFIKEFGLIDPNQDWNQANSAYVGVNLGETVLPLVKIYANYGSKYYLVAELENVKGKIDVPVDVPKGCTDVKVKIGSREYYGKLNSVIDCTMMSRGVPGVTYGHDDSGDYSNPNPALYNKSISVGTTGTTTYAVKVQHTKRGNGANLGFTDNGEYKYFNTQQMAPIVSTEKWDRYYSLNKLIWFDNPTADETSQSSWGILPERGVFNVPASKLANWLADKRREGKNIVEDFTIETGDDGSLTLFPYYYGTNLQHELGVYLIDENNNPILADGSTYNADNPAGYTLDDFVSFPVFENRQHGDLQVKHQFDGRIKGIRLKDGRSAINLVVGETTDIGNLVEINLKGDGANDNWVAYNDYIAANETTSHSRLAVHVWDNEKNDWVKFENYHTLKTLKTGNASGLIGIATGMTNTESGKGKTIGYVATVNYKFTTERVKEYTLTSDIPNKVELEVGETRVYHITSLKEVGKDQDIWDSTNNIKVTDQWYANDMDLILDKSARTLTIKANKACTEKDARNPRIYIDEDNSGNCDNGEIELKVFNVVITGSSTPEYVLTSDIPSKVELEVGETRVYHITSLKQVGNDQDIWDSTNNIKVADDWDPDYMDLILDKTNRTLTIKAKKASVETDYRNPIIYIDNDNNNYTSDGDTELKKFLVVISEASTPSTTIVQHSYSQTYTVWPLSSPTWQSFFHDSNASAGEISLYTGSDPNNYNNRFYIAADKFSEATDEHNLVFAITLYSNGTSVTECDITIEGSYDGALPGVTSTQTITSSTTSITIPLTSELITELKKRGIIIVPPAQPYGFIITSVALVPKNPQPASGDPVWAWNSNGKTSAASALVTHYSNSANYPSGSVNCASHQDEQISFTGANISVGTPSVTIAGDANYTTVKYTVTWPVNETVEQSSGAPRHKAPARRLNKSHSRVYTSPAPRRAASRDVEAGRPAMLRDDIAAEWSDVNSYWTPVLPQTQEVASYPPNMTMLGRSRGYDFTITVNGQPYNGKVGVYMKVLGDNHLATNDNPDWDTLAKNDNGYYEGVDPSSDETKTYNDVTFPYVVFSQKRFNKDATGAVSDQIASLVFKHPTNPESTYMTFEDMLLTNSSHQKVGKRESSDRDVNDLIFNITNYKSVGGGGSNLTERDEDDEGFPWIWALEDLGATDDFDFNDLVVKVSCITKMHTTQKDGVDVSGTATKKLTFTPLCAGGTLPLYIHFKMDDVDYILKPGSYNLTEVEISGVTATGDDLHSYSTEAEVHHWFGNFNSGTMINTGAGATASSLKSCQIYVPAPTFNKSEHKFNDDGFNLNIFTKGSPSGTTIDNTANLTKSAHFLASVNQKTQQGEIGDDRTVNEYEIVNEELGAAPQSFIIMAPDWRWPLERHHILDAYPEFRQWVKSKSNTTWTNNVNSAHLY